MYFTKFKHIYTSNIKLLTKTGSKKNRIYQPFKDFDSPFSYFWRYSWCRNLYVCIIFIREVIMRKFNHDSSFNIIQGSS